MDIKHIRTRWAAVGAAVAITLGAGGIGITHATTSSGPRAIYTPINPCRLADLRPAPDTVGSRTIGLGPDEVYTLDGWGAVGDCSLPIGTSGLALNVTAVSPTAATFLRLWPADGAQPTTSNLNPAPGQPATPNAVNVGLSATGQFSIFNRFGVVNVIIDVVGVYDDHNHDDRYYQKSEVDAKTGPQTHTITIPSTAFRPRTSDTPYSVSNSTGGAVVTGPTAVPGLNAPVVLPHGSVIQSITYRYLDDSTGSLSLGLGREGSGLRFLSQLGKIATTGQSPAFRETTVTPLHTVGELGYYIGAYSTDWPTAKFDLRVKWVEITYTLPS